MALQLNLKKPQKVANPFKRQLKEAKPLSASSEIAVAYERWNLAKERFEHASDNALAELLAFDLAAAEMQYVYLLKAQKAKL